MCNLRIDFNLLLALRTYIKRQLQSIFFLQVHKTYTSSAHMGIKSSQIDCKYTELSKYESCAAINLHVCVSHLIAAVDGPFLGYQMTNAKCTLKICLKSVFQNMLSTHCFSWFCIVMDTPEVKRTNTNLTVLSQTFLHAMIWTYGISQNFRYGVGENLKCIWWIL